MAKSTILDRKIEFAQNVIRMVADSNVTASWNVHDDICKIVTEIVHEAKITYSET